MSKTIEVDQEHLETVLKFVAQESRTTFGVPDDVDESAIALEKALYEEESC